MTPIYQCFSAPTADHVRHLEFPQVLNNRVGKHNNGTSLRRRITLHIHLTILFAISVSIFTASSQSQTLESFHISIPVSTDNLLGDAATLSNSLNAPPVQQARTERSISSAFWLRLPKVFLGTCPGTRAIATKRRGYPPIITIKTKNFTIYCNGKHAQ